MQEAYASAIALLARREHSAKELATKLIHKGFVPSQCSDAIAQLQAEGLQSERRFAESFFRSWVGKGRGWLRIRADLQQHEIAAEIIAEIVEEAAIDWQAATQAAWDKKFGVPARTASEKAKQMRFLQQRGFELEFIRHVIG